jgi:uncharacterized membrane protein YbhN (UPF0104 family)
MAILLEICGVRIVWSRVGFLLSLIIMIIAGMVLYRQLQEVNLEDVVDAARAFEKHSVVKAAMFVAAGYFTLTFYDLFALRTIGRSDISYKVAALAGFTSYAVGHNVGASAFTGGAVRYRIYSHYGFSGIDVAKVCFIAALTFWLGNVTVLALGVAYAPQAASTIDQMPAWVNRSLAFGMIGMLTAYVLWVWRTPRVVGRDGGAKRGTCRLTWRTVCGGRRANAFALFATRTSADMAMRATRAFIAPFFAIHS